MSCLPSGSPTHFRLTRSPVPSLHRLHQGAHVCDGGLLQRGNEAHQQIEGDMFRMAALALYSLYQCKHVCDGALLQRGMRCTSRSRWTCSAWRPCTCWSARSRAW